MFDLQFCRTIVYYLITENFHLVFSPLLTSKILINGNSKDHFNKGVYLHKHRTTNNLYINFSYLF